MRFDARKLIGGVFIPNDLNIIGWISLSYEIFHPMNTTKDVMLLDCIIKKKK
jgi:hypothetical protein